MGRVGTGFSTSLDGFIAGPNDDVSEVFRWYAQGDMDLRYPGGRVSVRVSQASANLLQEMVDATGALVVGRRHFDGARGWGGRHPIDRPVFVVSHRPPPDWLPEGSPFTFVPGGVERAIELAREAAGDRNVGVGGANVAQQALWAGLVDDLAIDLVPVVLGAGVPFFSSLVGGPVRFEHERTVEGTGVTHLRFRVVR